jgi:hypothetical protein
MRLKVMLRSGRVMTMMRTNQIVLLWRLMWTIRVQDGYGDGG